MKLILKVGLSFSLLCASSIGIFADNIESNHCICNEEMSDVDKTCNEDTNNQCQLKIENRNTIVNEDK